MPYVWIGVLIAALIVEANTFDFVSIWFAPAALVAMILAFCSVPTVLQILVFALVGLLLVLAMRPLCRRFIKGKESKTNTDALIGETALVTEEISNLHETGEVKLKGLRWSARAAEAREVFPVGTQVKVLEISGVKLIVTAVAEESKNGK